MTMRLPEVGTEAGLKLPATGGRVWRSAEKLSAEARFLEYLDQIDAICESAGRRGGLSAMDVEDFVSWARLRLIEDDYRVVRSFRGRGDFGHFLSVVLHNLLRDYRTQLWGKWRPSANARRLDCAAEHMETLVFRDGFSVEEAVEIVLRSEHVTGGRSSLERLAEQLPGSPRPEVLGGDAILALRGDGDAEDRMTEGRKRECGRRLREGMAFALRNLAEDDRQLLNLHFQEGMPLARVAADLGVNQRSIYRQRDRCLELLRNFLDLLGIRWSEVREIFGGEGCDLGLERLAPAHGNPGAGQRTLRSRVDAA